MTKGLYVPLGRGAEGLNSIYQEKLRLMPKTDLNQRMEKIPLEKFVWPLALAVLLLLVEFFCRIANALSLPMEHSWDGC